MVCLNKKTSSRQEFPRGSCLRFLFYGPITVILKIRQIHNIFIPYYFHWKEKQPGFTFKTPSALSAILLPSIAGTRGKQSIIR
jgi:hypothetical protein